MRAALRHLCQKGAEALKPQKVLSKAAENGFTYKETHVWRRPVVSKRVGKVLRKQALRDGTYGTFDVTTGVGWDPLWDPVLMPNQFKVSRYGRMQPKKKTSRERTREERAQKIEKNLETRLDKMEEYYANKETLKVKDTSFEAKYKQMMRSGARGGPGGA
uniref:MRPL25 domain-containing protein n=1 Tax=Craspedostauros australis TaxID=1486917 RepID=A0A7R9ZNN0_9STRA|mmetsp:Transcript_3925/g.10348  ORF Transcript_3925/g.10348 Transcript_3925/m.10348 type:complete len:160 (+) Transcript_3925:142-621(+)